MPESTPPGVEPRSAATVVVVHHVESGIEVLLTRRPTTMAFAADVFVFPGGAVEPGDADTGIRTIGRDAASSALALVDDRDIDMARTLMAAAIRELSEEAGVRLAAHALVPLSRWVTPPILPRRFDARFFVAELPTETVPRFDPSEVVEHRWLSPKAALDAMAAGEIDLWTPTATTLSQLVAVRSAEDVRRHLAPVRPARAPEVERVSASVTRLVLDQAGGVPGQPVNAYLVGHRRLVLVDPGDPSEGAASAMIATAAAQHASITAILLTSGAPEHVAGAEGLAIRLGIPILGGPGVRAAIPAEVEELADGAPVDVVDTPLRSHALGGTRPDGVALELVGEDTVVCGDLVGPPPERTLPPAPVTDELAAARRRLSALAGRFLPGHGAAIDHRG